MGEYVLQVRNRADEGDRDSVDGTVEWVYTKFRPCVDVDPVPDREDHATEQAAIALRATAERYNRTTGWYKYRTIYTDDGGSARLG